MAKTSGLGDNLYVGGYDLSGDIGSLQSIHGGPAALDVTPISKSGYQRIGGPRDGGIDFNSFFNPDSVAGGDSTDQEHVVLSALPTGDVHYMYCRGTTLGGAAACLVGKQLNYDPTRGADGAFTFAVSNPADGYGLEWGELHTAGIRADTGATNGTGVDAPDSAASAFGLQAYLQVFSITGTDATIKLQESSDNGSTDAWADVVGGGFTTLSSSSSHTTERIATAVDLAVERYLRIVTTTSAGFTALSFAVAVVRNLSTPEF